eukprot:gene12997-15359_t
MVLSLVALLMRFNLCKNLFRKSSSTGQIPLWSTLVFWSFHWTNFAFISVFGIFRSKGQKVPAISQILDGWYLGGRNVTDLPAGQWACVIDLTNEFNERASFAPGGYMNVPTWDGSPPDEKQFDLIGDFIAERAEKAGPVIVHCAYGVGRSTTVLCAALVIAGKFRHFEDAYNHIREKRPIVRLNFGMRSALERWQTNRDKR